MSPRRFVYYDFLWIVLVVGVHEAVQSAYLVAVFAAVAASIAVDDDGRASQRCHDQNQKVDGQQTIHLGQLSFKHTQTDSQH